MIEYLILALLVAILFCIIFDVKIKLKFQSPFGDDDIPTSTGGTVHRRLDPDSRLSYDMDHWLKDPNRNLPPNSKSKKLKK
jgi:hypothetical protein